MELEYLKTANSVIMWISVLPAVILVVYQALLFTKRAVSDGKKMGVTSQQMKVAAKSSLVASIGPSIVIVIGMVGLLSSVGGPVAWMRLAYIGSIMFELPAANIAATAAGSELGTANMTMAAYANAVWVMTIACLGWILVSALFTDKMGVFRDKVAGNNKVALAVIATAGGLGGFGYQAFNRFVPSNKIPWGEISSWVNTQTVTLVAGFVIMVAMNLLFNKTKKPWMKQFGVTIAMVGGMLVGSFFL